MKNVIVIALVVLSSSAFAGNKLDKCAAMSEFANDLHDLKEMNLSYNTKGMTAEEKKDYNKVIKIVKQSKTASEASEKVLKSCLAAKGN